MEFKPKIIGFLCNWCSYQGADLAGTERMKYPANLIPIRVMCSSSVSPQLVLKAFQKGADGVLVAGCHIGDCHYQKTNYMTMKWMAILKELLSFMGLGGQRLRIEWISATEGEKFAKVVGDFTSELKRMGPSSLKRQRATLGARPG